MPPPEQTMLPSPDSERTHARGVRRIGPAPPDQTLAVTLVLRPRPDAPELPHADHWASTPIRQRRYLPRYDDDPAYGADPAEVEKGADFAKRHGLTVVGSHLARRRLDVTGTVAQFDAAFGISLGLYGSSRETYHGHEGALHVPRALVSIVHAVFGLDGRRMAERLSGSGLTLSPLTPPDVGGLYGFSSLPTTMSS